MITQPALPGFGRARRRDPLTSRLAAARQGDGWEHRIRAWMQANPDGGTDNEICLALGVDPVKWPTVKTARSRVTRTPHPLGLIRDGQAVHVLEAT